MEWVCAARCRVSAGDAASVKPKLASANTLQPLLCINTRIPGPSPGVLFVSPPCLAAECQQPNASTAWRAPGASAQPSRALPKRQRLCISQCPWQGGIESLAANTGSPGRDEEMGGGGQGGLHAASALGGFCWAQPREMSNRRDGREERRVQTKGFKANEERQHPSQQTPTSHYEHCMDNSRAQGTARDIGVSGSIPGTHAVPPPWAPSMGQLVGVLQPDKEEQAEAPNAIFPPKGARKRLTLQDQGDHRHCCARLILCHAAVKPHNSTLMSKHH